MKKNVLSAVLAVMLLTTGLSGCGVKKKSDRSERQRRENCNQHRRVAV